MSVTTEATNSQGPTWMTPEQWGAYNPKARSEWEQQKRSVEKLKGDIGITIFFGSFCLFGGFALVIGGLYNRDTAAIIATVGAGGGLLCTTSVFAILFAIKTAQYDIKSKEIKKSNVKQDYRSEIENRKKEIEEEGKADAAAHYDRFVKRKAEADKLQEMLDGK